MCVALLAGAVDGFCNKFRSILHGRPKGEKGEKAVLKDVIVETGIDILIVLLVGPRVLREEGWSNQLLRKTWQLACPID